MDKRDNVNKKPNEEKKDLIPNYVKYTISALAGCGAVTVCHPIDVLKNRMQLSGEGGVQKVHKTSFHAALNIAKNEGFASFYNGFSANIFRQLTYTTMRLGTYQVIIEEFDKKGVKGLKAQINSSLLSGFLASFLATPVDVALVRMTVDNRLPPSERRNYRHVFDALWRIFNEEGLKGLWTGTTPTVLRAMAANLTQIVSYVQTKNFFIDNNYMDDGTLSHLVSSIASGLIYAVCTVPLDVAKTRLQNMKKVKDKPQYTGLYDVFTKIYKQEGLFAFWKGMGPYYFKIAPTTILLFLISEKLTLAYKRYVLHNPDAKGGF